MWGFKFKINKIYEIEQNDSNYPQNLNNVLKTKPKIYAMGNLELLNNRSIIAIVGSRKNTEYGARYAAEFAYKLSSVGVTIISGLAIGIDTIAHKYSMKNKGHTIAVLGSGLRKIYPAENKDLFYEILENGGCVVSKEKPDEEADLSKFPKRNEIIAGISCGIVVVEARARSGSQITAKYGMKQNKPIFCIPNRLNEKTGVGTNNLIKNGAKLVTNVNDILETIKEEKIEDKKFNFELEEKIREEIDSMANKNAECIVKNKLENRIKTLEIDKKYLFLYEILKEKPMEINEFARRTNKTIVEIEQDITIMEIENLVEITPRKHCKNKGVICIINNQKENMEKILHQNI